MAVRFALVLAVAGAAGCGSGGDGTPVRVHDQGSLLRLDRAALDSLDRDARTLNATFVIATAHRVDVRALSVSADRASEKLDEGRFWPSRMAFPRSSRAVTFFYSERPRLLQIRYGRSFQHRARLAGLDYGPRYSALQQTVRADGRPDLAKISERITRDLAAVDLPFYRAWPLQLVSFLDDEMLPLLTMPVFELWDGMASLAAVHIYNALGRMTSGYFTFAAALVALVFLPGALFVPIYSRFSTLVQTDEGPSLQANSPAGCLLLLAFTVLLLVTIFPLLGLLALSANQRAEDVMALQAMGVRVTFTPPTDLPWYIVVMLVMMTLVARLLPMLVGLDGEDDSAAGRAAVKLLFVVPIGFFVLPAWTVVLVTYMSVLGALLGFLLARLMKRRSPSDAQHDSPGDATD